MTVVPLAEARANLSKLVDSATGTHERITITRNGVPAVIMQSVEDYEATQETLEILADSELMAEIRAGAEELAAGLGETQADLERAMREAGRL